MIREVYDNDNAQEIFEVELERAIQVNESKIFTDTFDSQFHEIFLYKRRDAKRS